MTTKEIKFVKAKIKGKNTTQAAIEATGLTNKASAAVQGNRMLKNANVQEALQKALKRHDITIDKVLAPISKALTYQQRHVEYKTTVKTKGKDKETITEPIITYKDDLDMQLRGSDRAVKLMGLDKQPETPVNVAPIDNEALMEAIRNGDMVTLQQIVFNKDD